MAQHPIYDNQLLVISAFFHEFLCVSARSDISGPDLCHFFFVDFDLKSHAHQKSGS